MLISESQQLAEELHKPIIRKFEKLEVLSFFKDIIWYVDLVDMQLISKYNKGFPFLLCAIDIFSKYAWIVPLKDEKGIAITDAFQKFYLSLVANQTNISTSKNQIYKYITSISKKCVY